MARRRRKPRPPEALRRLFKSRARSLEGAILSLLPTLPPSSPEDCPSCRGCLCLVCLGRSHLVEDGDPLEYRRLLDRAFCVVSAEAPPPPTVYRCNGWDQRQIVRNTRDLLWNSRKCNNALCIGQEGNNCLNSTNDVLCSHPWGLLLERIGDQLMVFLLRFSSIFLPLTNKRYHQVTGPPLNEFLPSLPVPSSSLKSQIQQSSLYLQNHVHIELEHSLTKKQVGKEGKPKKSSCTPRRHSSRYSKIINGGSIPLHFHDMHIEQFVRPSHNDYSARESCDTDEFHYPSICTSKSKSKKRTRYFSWHRNKKFKKQLELFRPVAPDVGTEVASWKDWIVSGTPQCGQWIGTGVIIDDEVDIVHAAQVNHGKNVSLSVESNRSFPETLSANEQEKGGYSNMGSYEIQPATSGKTLNIASSHNDRTQTILQTESSDKLPVKDHGSSMKLKRYHHKKMTFQCFYCMALQTAGKVSLGDQIKRHFIFYNRSSTYFTFPRRHILERLKANEAGAISLMKSIFGFPSEESQSNTRFSGSCGLKCQCLYHRLLSLLKSLIQNAHRCRYRTLLLKHCVFPNFARCGKDSSGSTSEGRIESIDKERLHLLLTEHLKNNILQIGHTFYLQKTGITQGSCVSALLCSFYYAHLEKTMIFPFLEKTIKQPVIVDSDKHDMVCQDKEHCFQKNHASRSCTDGARFKNLSSPKNLLLRLIDDFLFISTSRAQATSFFNKMNRGFEKYNCKINKKKIGLNFEVIQFQNFSNRIYIGADGIQFLPWSGLLLNCQTLEIQADYTRYLDVHISSTITVQVGSSPYCELKAKLHDYMRPKCHPIFYDSTVNSAATVRLNAYQAFLLGAMKFHCYVYRIPNNAKLNPSYLLDMIEQSLRYMHKLIKKHTENMEAHFNIHPVLKLKKREIIWLGLSAYIWVLKKKQSSHKKLLSLLRCKIATYGRMEGASAPLKYAVDDSHSSLFSKLKF